MANMYAVVDCNNFFVSCERLFRPELEGRPVIVLSNNDGCAVTRSNEAKPFIPMGAPVFKYKDVIEREKIISFSANFRLYGDLSQRIMSILEHAVPYVQQYSVDEAFLEIGSLGLEDYEQWARELRGRILQWTGLPVAIGVGPTKTLAKAAVERAKKTPECDDVLSLDDPDKRRRYLSQLPVEDVWGVGRRLAPKLHQYGIHDAQALANAPTKWMRQFTSVVGMRVVQELAGIDCFGMEVTYNQPAQHTIAATRSFGRAVSGQHELEAALASFIARAAHKARRQELLASELRIFISTGKHARLRRTISERRELPVATADTGRLTAHAVELLNEVYDSQYSYKRAGIMLGKLVPRTAQQQNLLAPVGPQQFDRRERLMATLDNVNHKWGSHTLKVATEGVNRRWRSKREHTSPAYTTRWRDLPVVKT